MERRGRHERTYVYRRHTVSALLSAVFVVAALSGCPRDTAPPGNITAFTATAGDTQIMLAWTNPADADFAGVLVQRKTGGYPSSPTDGTQVFRGTGTSFADPGLVNGTPYYYAAFAYDTSTNYASGAQANAVPTIASVTPEILVQFEEVRAVLTGPASSVLSPAETGPLTVKLREAEEAYRGGDTCGAAALLGEYESLAQGFRQGSTRSIIFVGGCERLYNEGRRLRYDMIAGTSMKDLCPGQERVGLAAEATVDDAQTDNTQVIATASFGEPKLLTVEANGEVFTQLDLPGSEGMTGDPGTPALPMMRRLIAVPTGAEVSLNLNPGTTETIYMNLIPRQPEPVDAEPDPPPDPSTFADLPFVKDDATYQMDQFLPENPCSVTEVGQLRDLRVFVVEWSAGQYNPKTNALRLFNKVDVELKFSGGDGTFLSEDSLNPFEISFGTLTGGMLNRAKLGQYIGKPGAVRLYFGEEFMILTPHDLFEAANKLADWKNEKGIVTNVFEVGPGTPYVSNTDIAGLIKNEYEKAKTRPSYVLLLGGVGFIPTFYTTPNGDVGSATIATDYPYASFIGILPILPNVALGRIPVGNLADANVVVDKIISYEKTPPGNRFRDFYENAAIASQFQCCRPDVALAGTDQRTFVETSEFARNVLVGAGYAVQRIYTRTADSAYVGETTPRRYYDGTPLPHDLNMDSGFFWSGTGVNITGAFHSGKFLFIHRDHGWPGGWANPGFDWFDASALINGNMLPVVFSVNCASGLFDQETAGGALGSASDAQYFAERMLVNSWGGAIGILGDTRNSPSWANSALLRGYIDAIWPSAIPGFGDSTSHLRLGDILNHGKVYLFTQGSTSGMISWGSVGDELRLWHCIGDPTLEIWTRYPYRYVLPNEIEAVPHEALLSVHYGAAGAMITAVQRGGNHEIIPIARGMVGEDGTADLPYVHQPAPGVPIQYVANLPNTVSSMTLK